MNWLSAIFQLIPIIAAGIQHLHAEKSVETKTQLAQDALGIAVKGAQVALPATDAVLATEIGSIASATIGSTVQALHNAANPPQTEAAA